jgi:deazaflavin-dependent oxidoreductase (nitroreductase family)
MANDATAAKAAPVPPRFLAKLVSRTHVLLHRLSGGRWLNALGGASRNPIWYQSLVAYPDIEARHRRETKRLRARLAGADEKPALWPICDACYAPYAVYRKRTTRDIPIFVCEPRAA